MGNQTVIGPSDFHILYVNLRLDDVIFLADLQYNVCISLYCVFGLGLSKMAEKLNSNFVLKYKKNNYIHNIFIQASFQLREKKILAFFLRSQVGASSKK